MTTAEHPNQYIFDHTINSEREAYLTEQLVAFNQWSREPGLRHEGRPV